MNNEESKEGSCCPRSTSTSRYLHQHSQQRLSHRDVYFPSTVKIMTPRPVEVWRSFQKLSCELTEMQSVTQSPLDNMSFKFDFDVESEEPQASGSTVTAPLERGEVKPSHDISLKDLVSAHWPRFRPTTRRGLGTW